MSGVMIEYIDQLPISRQTPEFYVDCAGMQDVSILTKGDREVRICRNGDMYLVIPDLDQDGNLVDNGGQRVVRYTSDLFDIGIKDDIQFIQFLKTISNAGFQIYHENPWWEIYSENDPDGIVSDSDNYYEAEKIAMKLLDDEDYWEAIEEWK